MWSGIGETQGTLKFGQPTFSSMSFLELQCPGVVITQGGGVPRPLLWLYRALHVFFQVYEVQLDSRFEPRAGHGSTSGGGEKGRNLTLDIEWSFAADTAPLGLCQWRVCRLRGGSPDFAVKEGIGTEQWVTASQTDKDGTELRDGYRYRTAKGA